MTLRDTPMANDEGKEFEETPRHFHENKKMSMREEDNPARNYNSEEFRAENMRTAHQPQTGRTSTIITNAGVMNVKIPMHIDSAVKPSSIINSAELSVHEQSVLDQPELMSLVQQPAGQDQTSGELVVGEQIINEKEDSEKPLKSVIEDYAKIADSSYKDNEGGPVTITQPDRVEGDSARKDTSYQIKN